jgi:ketosteroid isomerase-like protein
LDLVDKADRGGLMASPAENVAKLKDADRHLMADHVRVRSLAAGAPEATFTGEVNSKADFERYFKGLLDEWEMIDYKTTVFIAEGEHVAMRGSTAWRHRRTGRIVDTPKADFWTFHDGKIVEFYELYDTAAMFAAAQR